MKTFLELVNDVERESGTVSLQSRTSDVTSPGSGRQEKIIAMVNEAYRQIQTARNDWPWRRSDFSHALTIGQTRYLPSDLGITSFSRWTPSNEDEPVFSVFDPTIGQAEESGLVDMTYRAWRATYDFGAHDAQRPIYYAIDDGARLCVGPKPDKPYVLRGSYQRGVHVLSVNGDTPIIPADHQQVVVWKALVLLHGHDEGEFALGNAAVYYRSDYRMLVNNTSEMLGAP